MTCATTDDICWIVTDFAARGIRGVFQSQRDAEAEIAAICADHEDLTRKDFIIGTYRVRPAAPPAPTAEPDVIQTVVRVTCGARNFNATLPVSDYQRIIALLSGFAYTRMDELESQAPAPPERVSEGKELLITRQCFVDHHELCQRVGECQCPCHRAARQPREEPTP